MYELIRSAWSHPIVKGVVAVAIFVAVASFLAGYIPLAWAQTEIPLGGKYVIQLGELPQWIIAFVAAGGLWKAWKAELKIKEVSVQIDGLLTDRDKAKVKEGEAKEKLVGEDTAATLAKGQEQGRAMAGQGAPLPAPVAGQNPIIQTGSHPIAQTSPQPVPVVDEQAAQIAERSVAALERTAKATEEKK